MTKKLENLLSSVVSTYTSSKECVSMKVGEMLSGTELQTQSSIISFMSQTISFNHRFNEDEVLKWISGKMEGVTLKDVFYKWYAYKMYSFEPTVKSTYSWNLKRDGSSCRDNEAVLSQGRHN